jgi:uncharacterized protein YcbK (DUF882 family)
MWDDGDDLAQPSRIGRRALLTGTAAAALIGLPRRSRAASTRSLALYHTHTGEKLRVTYAENGATIPDALAEIDRFLRDFRTGEIHTIDRDLLDLLCRLRGRTGDRGTFEIISGYRSPRTNEMLRRTGGGGVAKRSLHMDGKAVDVRLTGIRTARLREEAIAMQAGGVGFYPQSDFVHVDTGRVRQW